jgi:hypothetical protein
VAEETKSSYKIVSGIGIFLFLLCMLVMLATGIKAAFWVILDVWGLN